MIARRRSRSAAIARAKSSSNADWLLHLRWVAVIGQLLTITIAHFGLQVQMPIVPLVVVVAITAVSNLGFTVWGRSLGHRDASTEAVVLPSIALAGIMALDLCLLTTLLYFTGGPSNPFSIFYLVNLALAAVILSEHWSWLLAGVAVAGAAVLVFVHVETPDLHRPVPALAFRESIELQEIGRVVAMAACALVIIHFVSRVTRQLERTASELRRVERERSRSEKLEALGTLAGGAAHELATPLSTIAVVAKEMLRHLQDVQVPTSVREDAGLIRSQVDQCQAILQRMAGRAGQWMAESHVTLSLSDLIAYTVDELSQADRVDVDVPVGAAGVSLNVPRETTAQALRGLLQNALDATQPPDRVRLSCDWDHHRIHIRVRDRGPGMPQEVLERAGEPFFTTKEPGRGMGLGLFLTRTVVERLNGSLQIESPRGAGVTATVMFPRED